MTEPALLKTKEVAEFLGISQSQVYRLIRSGELPTVPIGKDRRVSRQALLAWVDRYSRLPR
jgi:excisionase family DNA binding protein